MEKALKIVENSTLMIPLLLNEIRNITNGEEFTIIIFIGESGVCKSRLCRLFSGVKHDVGDGLTIKTRGAYLAYCGRMSNLISKHELQINDATNLPNLHIFCIDTECIFGSSETSNLINFIFPLISVSSVMIYNAKDAALITPINLLKTIQFFSNHTKLIVRISEFPYSNSIKETNYNYFISNSSLYQKLKSENINFEMIPDFILSQESSKLRKSMRRILFEEIVKNCHVKTWENTESLSLSIQQANLTIQDNLFQSAFRNPSPEQYLLDGLLKELRNYLKVKKNELDTIDNNDVPLLIDEIYHYLVNHFLEFCSNHNILGNHRNLCWDNINNDFNIIKTISLNRQQKIIKQQILETKKGLKQQEIIRKLTELKRSIPLSANDFVSNIINQCHYDNLIPIIESQRNEFEINIRFYLKTFRNIIPIEMMNIIDVDILKISQTIDNFICGIVDILKKRKTIGNIKIALKFASVLMIICKAFNDYEKSNDIDLESIRQLGIKSFSIIDTFIGDEFPVQNPDELFIPHFIEKDYPQIFQDNYCT